MISSRTPEGWHGRCTVCGYEVVVEPSATPTRDAPCPDCGSLVWFTRPDELRVCAGDLQAHLGGMYSLKDESDLPPDVVRVPEGTVDGVVRLWEEAGRPNELVLDFTGVKWFDSGCLGMIVRLHQRMMQSGGRMRISNLSTELRKLFELTKLDDMLSDD